MKIRWKYLSFLAVFLLGSFMIVTWKSYSIFSQKYVKSLQMMEWQGLEKQAQYISQQFSGLQKMLGQPNEIEAQLKNMGIGLLAHVVNEDGKWKAQWFEGQAGFRKDAQAMTKQIPFDSLSSSHKSWHLVQLQEKMRGLAYVVPTMEKNKAGFYAFFFTKDFLNKLFKGQTLLETMVVYSPQIGQIYAVGDFDDTVLEKNKSLLQGQQSGVIPVSKQAAMYFYFHPDLQLYLLKTQSQSAFQVESPFYLITLFAIIFFLIGLSLVALDLLMKNLFGRLESVTTALRLRVDTPSSAAHFTDEVQELEYLIHYLEVGGEKLTPNQSTTEKSDVVADEAAATTAKENAQFLDQIRPKAINSLGYLHRLKAQVPATPHLQLLEKELREIRALIDPATATVQGAPPTPSQPYFNPILNSFKKEINLVETAPKVETPSEKVAAPEPETPKEMPTAKEIAEEVAAAVQAIAALNIRKPKREGHESNNL